MDSLERVLQGAEEPTLGWSPVSHSTFTLPLKWGEALLKSDCLHFLSRRGILSEGEKALLTYPYTHTQALGPFSVINCRMVGLACMGGGTSSKVTCLSTLRLVATPLCPWPVRFCLRFCQPSRQPGSCTHLTPHIISSLWNVTLCEVRCCLMSDTWAWREMFCSMAFHFPGCEPGVERPLPEMGNVAVDRPSICSLGSF